MRGRRVPRGTSQNVGLLQLRSLSALKFEYCKLIINYVFVWIMTFIYWKFILEKNSRSYILLYIPDILLWCNKSRIVNEFSFILFCLLKMYCVETISTNSLPHKASFLVLKKCNFTKLNLFIRTVVYNNNR